MTAQLLDIFNALHTDGFRIKKVVQNCDNLHVPCLEIDKRLLDGTIAHDGNPVLRWNASNVRLTFDSMGHGRPDKKRSVERIDGDSAGVVGIGMCMRPKDSSCGLDIPC